MAIKILKKEEITGYAFLKITKEEFYSYGMLGSHILDLANFAKELGKCKLKLFSSYKPQKNLSEVLHQYITTQSKSLEDDRETDVFLDNVDKKMVRNKIKQRNKKKKI
ncbi:hypothetical protein C1645_743323 [Glomus cerebriforme]|uniref:Uncharacterized protein n=1 Tax=Glomus cerebriforme TaxID=658196 RepID=A0A397SKI7_9GLOM|nr:hypothetical protein C1645_743323 [Glomus cerebriforme]